MLMRLVRGQVSGAFTCCMDTIPLTVLSPGQMAKCENCDNVHWQSSSVQVSELETGVEKVKGNGFNAQALKCRVLPVELEASKGAQRRVYVSDWRIQKTAVVR